MSRVVPPPAPPPAGRGGRRRAGGRRGQRRPDPVPAAEAPLPFWEAKTGRVWGDRERLLPPTPSPRLVFPPAPQPRTFRRRAHACPRPAVGRSSAPRAAGAGAKPVRKQFGQLTFLLRRACVSALRPGRAFPAGDGYLGGWGGGSRRLERARTPTGQRVRGGKARRDPPPERGRHRGRWERHQVEGWKGMSSPACCIA